MARTLKGTLIECDPSIKTMLLDMDSKMANKFIMSELDETHLLIDTTRVQEVQEMLQNIIEENTYAVNQ